MCDFKRCDLKCEDVSECNEPMNIRDAYYGGCANAIVLKDFTNGMRGRYMDSCSLYPTVLKYEKYPIGHPIHIVRDFEYSTLCDYQENPCGMEKYERKHWKLPYFGLMKLKYYHLDICTFQYYQ